MSPRLAIATACACLLALPPSACRAEGPPDRAALAATGRATAERLERAAASWTAAVGLPGGGGEEALVDVVTAPGKRRTTVSMAAGGRRVEMLRIVEIDGVWFAREGRRRGKYRPFEAPFDLGTAYHFLALARPQVVHSESGVMGEYEGARDGVATFRTPFTEPQKAILRRTLAGYEQLERQAPDAITPQLRRGMEDAREAFERGLAIKIDLATGILVRFGSVDRGTEIRDFRWLDRTDPEDFRIEDDGQGWDDFTDDPTDGDRGELVMIGHAGMWRPGMKGQESDGRLLDLKTKRLRRIPFQGSVVLPGCFLEGRDRSVVTGLDPFEGSFGLYQIDLRSGKNRRLGGDALAEGVTLGPVLSPDGRTIAALHQGGAERGVLDRRIHLVDLESGESRPLGDAGDLAYLSWLPDGRGLLLLWRESKAPDDPKVRPTKWICRIDLEGRVEKIREGNAPFLLDGRTILFRDDEASAWRTCALDGGDEMPFADGRAEYNFPAPAPDGKRLVMMRFRPGAAPVPTILPIGGGEGEPVVPGPGLWTMPTWR